MGKTTVWVVSFENWLYWKAISKEMTNWLDLDLENSFGVEKLASLVDQKIANLLSKIENQGELSGEWLLLKHQSRPSWEWWYGPASCSTRWSSRRGKPERKLFRWFDFRIFFYSRCVTSVQTEVWARWTLQLPLPVMGKHHRDCYENTVRPQIPIA